MFWFKCSITTYQIFSFLHHKLVEEVCNIPLKKKKLFCLLIFIERKRGGKEGQKHQCERETSTGCLLYAPWLGPNLQPWHVPWLRIKPATFHFVGCPINWDTQSRQHSLFLLCFLFIYFFCPVIWILPCYLFKIIPTKLMITC